MSASSIQIHDNHYVAFKPDQHHHHHQNQAHHSKAWSDSSSQSKLTYDRKRKQHQVPENFVVKNIESDENEAENNNKISLIFCIAIIIVAIIGLIVALVLIIFFSSTGTYLGP